MIIILKIIGQDLAVMRLSIIFAVKAIATDQ